ncbi:PKD domain-containing protein [Streptomyces sp. SP18BB07]|uniref:PKD domain-containing protein n=1 Tax=Streptomyces sp. SP18BB07 TaxID=3002522 RepID=UPI002E7A4DDE|nr:PKD domain-containing protein [Streptomyces sp. SP18BB07]MEE1762372.1 hypothetical protein [Streptomyces sp. SP18BB07]
MPEVAKSGRVAPPWLKRWFAVGVAVVICLAGTASLPAQAATIDRYRVELAAWIPQEGVDGPQPSKACFGYIGQMASYNGNNHVGFDGEYKVLVSYDFTYDGSRWADVATEVTYGPTYAYDAICRYSGHVTKDGGVKATSGGVQLWTSTKNPLVVGAPAIDAKLDVSFRSRDEMVLVHRTDRFPSHGFRVWKNGRIIGTAVDYDASCVNVRGLVGAANVGKGLSTSANPVTHDLDLRVPNQSYFGPCGKTPPPRFSFPALSSVPTPRPGNASPVAAFTYSRLNGPGNQVRLDGSGTRDPDGTISSYQWSSNGKSLGVGKTPVVSMGSRTTSAPVTLKVTDNAGASASVTRTLSLGNRAPTLSGVNPAPGSTYPNIRPTLSAAASDPDADSLQYSYRLTGNGADLSSGWVSGTWQIPPHSLDPGLGYSWTVTVRDGRGGVASRTSSLRIAALPTAKRLVPLSTAAGYWQVASDGGVFSYGAAPFYGSLPGLGIKVNNVIGMARTPDDRGYWLAAADGGVFAFGDAGFYGSVGGKPLNAPVVGMAPTPSGKGYWLAAADGGVFAFGDAGFYGSVGGKPLNAPVVDIQMTPSGKGYWLAAADGGVFAFGDAKFYGSMAGKPLNGRITSISPTPTASGYWLNGCDGGVFAFGDAPFYGSNPVYGCRGT